MFAVIYLSNGKEAKLISTTFDEDALPSFLSSLRITVVLDSSADAAEDQWPIMSVFQTGVAHMVTYQLDGSDNQALLLPIKSSHQSHASAVLIAGVNKYRELDKPYREWFDLVAGHIATALTNSQVLIFSLSLSLSP